MDVSKIRIYFLLSLLLGTLILFYFILVPFIAPLALAAVFATLLHPVYRVLVKRVRSTSLSALLTVVGSILCILVPLGVLGYFVFEQLQQSYFTLADGSGRFPIEEVIDFAIQPIEALLPSDFTARIAANADTYIRQGAQYLLGQLATILSGAAHLFLAFLIFSIAFYYLLKDGSTLVRTIVRLSPLVQKDDEEVLKRLSRAIHSVIVGSLTIALIQGAVSTVGYIIFGIPNAVLWGTVTAFAALIPGIGTSLVLIPAILYLVVTGGVGSALGLALWGVVAVGLVDNFLSPRLIGRGASLHPLLVLLSVLGGLAFFGPSGLFLGPLVASLALALLSLYTDVFVEENAPPST